MSENAFQMNIRYTTNNYQKHYIQTIVHGLRKTRFSWYAWHLKSTATRLFAEQFIQESSKENIIASLY